MGFELAGIAFVMVVKRMEYQPGVLPIDCAGCYSAHFLRIQFGHF